MDKNTLCSGCRFIVGDKALKSAAKNDAKTIMKRHGVTARIIVVATVTVAVSLALASHFVLQAVSSQFLPNVVALLSLALVFDFLTIVSLSLGIGLEIVLFTKGSLTTDDIPKAILCVMPYTFTCVLTVTLCKITATYFPGNERFLIISAIIASAFIEMKKHLFAPAAVAVLGCDAKAARRISERICTADRDIAKSFAFALIGVCAASVFTFLMATVFLFPKLLAEYTATAKLILPDYNILISYNHFKGEKAWQAKKNSL